MKLYRNNDRENPKIASYPFCVEVHSCDDLKKAVAYDHVCAQYKGNHRKNDNYLKADCSMFDVDNTHSENPAKWVDTESVKKAFPNVPFYVCYSRNHMKEKHGKAPRPKFHVYFPDIEITDPVKYSDLKHKVADYFTQFDQNAKDNARFFFGVDNPSVEYVKGAQPLSEFMKTVAVEEQTEQADQELSTSMCPKSLSDVATIPVGERNSTLFKYAERVLTRDGDTDIARQKYMERASCCEVQLETTEVEQIWSGAKEYFHSVIEQNPNYIPPEKFRRNKTQRSLKPSDYSDVGQAGVFYREYGEVVRYSEATRFLVYCTNVWVEDNIRAQGLVQELTEKQLEEARGLLKAAQQQEISAGEEGETSEKNDAKKASNAAKKYWKYIIRSRESQRISAILKEVRPKIQISPSDLDANRYLLNTPAGTVDLRTGRMRAHNPKDYCTKMTGVAPSSEGDQLFKDFLDTITCKDVELERYLQQVAGMCAIGQVKCEHMIIAYGRGKNGKSTFFNLLARVLGSYSGSLSAEVLTAKNTRNKGPELAELRGKRLVISSELEEGTMLNSAMVKNLCSTDIIKGEQKYKAPIEFSASHTLILHTNHLPQVRADDDGTWRRLVVVPFDAVISEKAEKKDFTETLYTEAGGSVLKWIIDGAKDFIENDYQVKMPIRVKEAIAEYRAENDWLGCFLSACCEIGAQYKVPSGDLYKRYQDYCKTEDEKAHSQQIFNSALEQRGFCAKRTNSTRYRTGLRLKEKIGGLPPYEFLHEQNVAKAENSDEGDDEIVEF